MKIAAFTLAEVLIALVIIGIVAALTVANIIADSRDAALKSKFKKSYSVISQAVNKAVFDTGILDCYITGDAYVLSDCQKFFDTLSKNLQIIKTCNSNALADGCIPEYSSFANDSTSSCSGFTKNSIENIYKVHVLNDGSIFLPYRGGTAPVLAIDVNGHEKPNEWGRDIFPFYITFETDKGFYLNYKPLYAYYDCPKLVSPKGLSTEDMFKKVYQ